MPDFFLSIGKPVLIGIRMGANPLTPDQDCSILMTIISPDMAPAIPVRTWTL